MIQPTTDTGHLVPATGVLDDTALTALGLTTADTPAIAEIGKSLQDITPGNLHVFGREAASKDRKSVV